MSYRGASPRNSDQLKALRRQPSRNRLVDRDKSHEEAKPREAHSKATSRPGRPWRRDSLLATSPVSGGKVEVEIWLAEATPEALEQLKKLGFEVIVQPKIAKVLIGRLSVDKLQPGCQAGCGSLHHALSRAIEKQLSFTDAKAPGRALGLRVFSSLNGPTR